MPKNDYSIKQFQLVLDSLDELVYVADMQTYEILFINKYGREIWGDITGEICWKKIQNAQTAPCSFCTNKFLLDEKGTPTGIYLWEFQNTIDHQWYECRDQAIPWPDGRLVRLEIARNITKRKDLEKKSIAQSKLASLGKIATGIAHEISQPLNFVRILFESIMLETKAGEIDLAELNKDSVEGLAQVRKISKIIEQLRVVGRDSAICFKNISLERVISNSLILMAQQLKLNNIALELDIPKNMPLINGDEHKLEQVFINLFQNAIHALEDKNDGKIKVSLYEKNGTLQICFSDNGSGIPAAHQENIFDPFFTTKEVGKGMGLGLSIAHGIIHEHRGEIEYTPDKEGASFLITLPLEKNDK